MCDYSLAGLTNRLAVEGEDLVVHRFRTGSMGLAAPADLPPREATLAPHPQKSFWQWLKCIFEGSPDVCAVCLPPGSFLILKNIPQDLQRQFHVRDAESAFFVQVNAVEYVYRDALQFRHGRPVLLQRLREGMWCKSCRSAATG